MVGLSPSVYVLSGFLFVFFFFFAFLLLVLIVYFYSLFFGTPIEDDHFNDYYDPLQ